MSGIFPRNGLAPGVDNSGIPLVNEPAAGCASLYYNESCAQKVDPRALNALISELVSIVNACPGMTYDCARRDNTLQALQCLFGLPPCPGDGCYELRCVNGGLVWASCGPAAGCGVISFQYTGAMQSYTVPEGVSQLRFRVWGGGGGGAASGGATRFGGPGGYAEWLLSNPVPGTTYYLLVGEAGKTGSTAGTFGGGGAGGGDGQWRGASGGGMSGVFTAMIASQATALVIAGGGGGNSGGDSATSGGPGGGMSGGAALANESGSIAGQGGTQGAGGAPGNGGGGGTAIIGGPGTAMLGGNGGTSTGVAGGGGGGGGGYYGGGGGAGDTAAFEDNDDAGGGGSGYAAPAIAGSVTFQMGSAGSGTAPATGVSSYVGGAAAGGGPSQNGGNGLIVIEEICS